MIMSHCNKTNISMSLFAITTQKRVVRQLFTYNIENAIQEYITKHAAKIELGFKNLNGTTFLQDMILHNVAILNQIYIAAQEDSILKELNGTC